MKRGSKTRNGNTWTEAQYWGAIRSALRSKFRYWVPLVNAKLKLRRPSQSNNTRLKWEYPCKICGGWFPEKMIQVDHIVPCGSLNSASDIEGFLNRLTVEDEQMFQVLCKTCHKEKTKKERKK